jgi:L-methionine (R)-S-oxide reductase
MTPPKPFHELPSRFSFAAFMNAELPAQISLVFEKNPDPDVALLQALGLVLSDFNSETGTIHLLDPAKQELHLAAQVGLPPQMLDIVRLIPVGKGIAGQTAARGEPVSICNLQNDSSGVAKPGARQTGVGGALCVPLRRDGAIVGTLGIGTRREHEYTPEETRALGEIAKLLAGRLKPQ